MRSRLAATFSAAAALLTACAEPAAVVIDPDDLLLSFQTTPDTLRAGGQVVATLTLTNPTFDTLRIESADGCLGHARILRWNETPSAIPIQAEPCDDTDGTIIIAPGESVVRHWTVTGWLLDSASGADTMPPPPGLYSVRLDTPTPLPDLVAPFTIWPSGYWFGWRRCGFAAPRFRDSIVVSASAETTFGSLPKPYRVQNFTPSAITLVANWARGAINGVQFGEGWSEIVHAVQRQTANGWEPYSQTVLIYEHAVTLQPNECLQAWNPLFGLPSGTYRLRIWYTAGWAYSDPVAVP